MDMKKYCINCKHFYKGIRACRRAEMNDTDLVMGTPTSRGLLDAAEERAAEDGCGVVGVYFEQKSQWK